MKVLLDMEESRFHEMFAKNELPGRLCGTENDMTLETMLTDEEIWHRIQDYHILSSDQIEQVHDYGLSDYLHKVINRVNHNFDPDDNFSLWDLVEHSARETFNDYFVESQKEKTVASVSLDGLRTCLARYDEYGEGKCGPWMVCNCAYDLSWELSYKGKPLIGCYKSGDLEKRSGFLPDSTFILICDMISSAFPECRINPETQAEIQKNNQGFHHH